MASLWLVPINARHVTTMLFELSKQWQLEGKQKNHCRAGSEATNRGAGQSNLS